MLFVFSAPAGRRVLVPPQCRPADAHQIDPAVAIQIRRSAGRARHVSVERGARPGVPCRSVNPYRRLSPRMPGDYLVAPVPVEVGDDDRVAVGELSIDDLPLQPTLAIAVDHDLMAMPRFDGGHELFLPEMADLDLARSAFRPRRRVASRHFRALPPAAAELIPVNAHESR